MTPVLLGRLQLRLIMFAFIAVPITFALTWLTAASLQFMFIAALAGLGVGLFCDCVYQFLQQLRWDKDWPPLYFWLGAVTEYLVLLALVRFVIAPVSFSLGILSIHFWVIWLGSMLAMFHAIHIFKPLYRYSGGKVLKRTDISTHIQPQ